MDASFKKSKTVSTPQDLAGRRNGRIPAGGRSGRDVADTPSLRGEYKVRINYETMFSDTRPRNRMLMVTPSRDRPPAPGADGVRLKAVQDMRTLMEVQGSHRTLFYRQPSKKHFSSYSTVVVDLEGSPKKVSFGSESDASLLEGVLRKEKSAVVITLPVKSQKMATKETQTDYRDSEAQTLPWKHEIKAEGRILKELQSLEWFTAERNFPAGMEEVTLIERARQKLAWESVLEKMRGKENESRRRSLALRVATAESAFREGKLDRENRRRIEMSRRLMREAAQRFQEKLQLRLQRSYGSRRKENDSKIDYWNHQLTRKLRKIKSAREQRVPKPKKQDIISVHQDKTSDLYAPKLRDGENPSLGHEVIDIQCRYLKRFHGLAILEKYLAGTLRPRLSSFDFGEAAKPKKADICWRKFRERALEEPEDNDTRDPLTLRIPVPAPTPEPAAPETARPLTDSQENLFQASLLLARLIKGRAVQTKKFLEYYKMAPE